MVADISVVNVVYTFILTQNGNLCYCAVIWEKVI